MPGYSQGLNNLVGEMENADLAIRGRLPDWLSGTLLRNGPALFDIGGRTLNHWFDGLAGLHKFDFADGKVRYSCKFLRSDAYEKARANQQLGSMEFGTRRPMSLLDRITNVSSPELTDNANVNVLSFDGHYMAATETPHLIEFSSADLSTIGPVRFDDHLRFHVTTAHPHFDFNRNSLYNIATTFGPKSHYTLFEQKSGRKSRLPIGRVATAAPGYMHSFAMSQRYAVFCEFPLRLSLSQLLFSTRPYFQCYHWWGQSATNFIVISKETGELVRHFEADAAFAFHQINAFECDEKLYLDMVIFKDAKIIGALSLDNLRSGGAVPIGRARRFCLDLANGKITSEDLATGGFEFPQINYRHFAGRPYKYCYGAGSAGTGDDFLDDLRKIDIDSGRLLIWQEAGCYPGEPVFVPHPGGAGEDDGVLLSLVLDSKNDRSFLLVLDAITMQEIAKLTLPQMAPFTFHGIFASEQAH